MRRAGERGILILVTGFFLMFLVIVCNYYVIAENRRYTDAAVEDTFITIKAGNSRGTIYDRNMEPLVNSAWETRAAVVPEGAKASELSSIAADEEEFRREYSAGKPFVFVSRGETAESAGVTFFRIPVRYSTPQPAQHIIGYLSEGKGAAGIECAYDRILRSVQGESSVTYSTDGFGNVLIGGGKSVVRGGAASGVVLTIDKEIQEICEESSRRIKKGAVVVSDVRTGDILASVSLPAYSWDSIGRAVEDEESPLIDRTLYAYSVGSIFKLVIACEGIEEGLDWYTYTCTGTADISGQTFNCHKQDGHGKQDMGEAMKNSCNTYFISLSRSLNTVKLRELASELGFGKVIHLCEGIAASSGYLPETEELLIPAELANFSFGQGKLTATPLHINQLTAAIANGGEMSIPRLIKGLTIDGEEVLNGKYPQSRRVIPEETAEKLRKMMEAAVSGNRASKAAPGNVKVGAKTSTAQTGRYDEEGEEYCHGWITGFFPAESPEYAVTVLAEDGGYGNEAAAPVFREIARRITEKGAS